MTDMVKVKNITGRKHVFSSENVTLHADGPKSIGKMRRSKAINYQRLRLVDIVLEDLIDTQDLSWLDANNNPTFHWMSPFSLGDGYATAAENVVYAMMRRGLQFSVSPCWFVVKRGLREETLAALEKEPKPHAVGICLATPGEFVKIPTPYKIGWTMYESTNPLTLHPEWLHQWREVDRLWVPSEFCKEIYSKFVDVPIDVDPLTVHAKYLETPPVSMPKTNKFRFITFGTLTSRKGPLETIKLFERVFPRKQYPDVELVLKTRMGIVGMDLKQLPELADDRIKVISADWLIDEMVSFLQTAHCMMFMSRGEGFGLPPREAMAMGIPTIFSDNTGTTDVADMRYNWPVRTKKMVPSVLGGEWAEPDWDMAGDYMKYIYDHSQAAFNKAAKCAKWYRKEHGDKTVVDTILDTLGKLDPLKKKTLHKKSNDINIDFGPVISIAKSLLNTDTVTLIGSRYKQTVIELLKNGINPTVCNNDIWCSEMVSSAVKDANPKGSGVPFINIEIFNPIRKEGLPTTGLLLDIIPLLNLAQVQRLLDAQLTVMKRIVVIAPNANSTGEMPHNWRPWPEKQWRMLFEKYHLDNFVRVPGNNGYKWIIGVVEGKKDIVRGVGFRKHGRIVEGVWRP